MPIFRKTLKEQMLVTLFSICSVCNSFSLDLPFDRTCPVFYDNDDHRDVYTGEYLMALAHLGEIQLVDITTTYAANAREYDLFVKGRTETVATARRSGLKHLPDAQPGTGARLKRPDSNRIEDTQPMNLAASRALVEEARKATPAKPLVFLTGGQMTVAADAVLLAPDIASKVVVIGLFGVPGRDYNASLDAWAWTIVMSRFRVFAVPFGDSKKRGTVFLKAAEVPKTRILAELPQAVPFFRWMYEKHHPRNGGPEEHDYDGQAAIALIRPDYITQVRRWRPDGIQANGDVKLVQDKNGPVYEAVEAKQEIATAEFWRTMKALAVSLCAACCAAQDARPRVIIETDAGGDPDDEQSLVRFLVYADEFDVEGLIANRPHARDGENRNPVRDGLGIVRAQILAYSRCYANLVQHDPRYPKPEHLLARTVAGYDDTDDGVSSRRRYRSRKPFTLFSGSATTAVRRSAATVAP